MAKAIRRFVRNFKRTIEYKILGAILITVGYLSTLIEGDATGFVFCLLLGLIVIFGNEEEYL